MDEDRYKILMVKLSLGQLTHDEQIELFHIVTQPSS